LKGPWGLCLSIRTTEIEQSACPKNVGRYEVLQGKFNSLKINHIHEIEAAGKALVGIKVQAVPGDQDILWAF
jgi:hypothetical protein